MAVFPFYKRGHFLPLLFLVWLIPQANAANVSLTDARAHDNTTHSRFVLDISGTPEYNVFTLSAPERVVIDIPHAATAPSFNLTSIHTPRIRSVRSSSMAGTLRLVLDMAAKADIEKHFILWPQDKGTFRLVVDIATPGFVPPASVASTPVPVPVFSPAGTPAPVILRPADSYTAPPETIGMVDESAPIPVLRPSTTRKPVIILDAGHGGHDPGATSRRRTREKYITLSYAQALRYALVSSEKYTVHLTRNSDTYVPLRERVRIGQKYKGDLFISLHADSHDNQNVRGLSIYTLSETASDREAAALAARENKEGLIGSMDFSDADESVTDVLVEIAQRDAMNLSSSFAESAVENLRGDVYTLSNTHRFAGFRVLTAPDMPSVLIELGYLSNRHEEDLLRSENYKKRLVDALVQAIDMHFTKHKVE